MADLVVTDLGTVADATADLLDILTLAEAKRALNIPQSDTDVEAELAQVITSASRFVDSVYGPVVNRSVTRTFPEPKGTIRLPDVPPGSPTFTVTFTSVTEYSAGTATVLTAEDADTAGTYRYYSDKAALKRRSSWSDTSWGSQEVVVVYTAGRAVNTAAVDEKFKEAGAVAVAHLWQHRGANSAAGVPGSEGQFFGGVPFKTGLLREKLREMYPEEALLPGLA